MPSETQGYAAAPTVNGRGLLGGGAWSLCLHFPLLVPRWDVLFPSLQAWGEVAGNRLTDPRASEGGSA